jgi:hypothetical protein
MLYRDRFDSLIRYHAEKLWPGLDWRLVKAQVSQESGFRPTAKSPCGAAGLLQLMPATDREVDGDLDGFEVDGNLDNGVRYLKRQYESLGEVPDPAERMRMALAAYNGGLGYIKKALRLARFAEMAPAPPCPGRWQSWETVRCYLRVAGCDVRGKRPDFRQMERYVDGITETWRCYRAAELSKPDAKGLFVLTPPEDVPFQPFA